MHGYRPTLQQSCQGCFDGGRGSEHPLKSGQVGTKWPKIVFPLIHPDYCLLAQCQISSGWLSATGAQPLIQLRPQTFMTAFFFCPKLQQPGITLREELDRVNPTYFQSAVRKQSVALRWRVTARCEFNGLHYCLAQAIIMTEMEIMVFFLFEDVSVWRSDHAENGGIKGGEVQIVNIDFHQNREKVTLRGSVSFCLEDYEDKKERRLMTSQMNSGSHHSSLQSSVYPVSSWYSC